MTLGDVNPPGMINDTVNVSNESRRDAGIEVRDIGRMAYGPALELQRQIHQRVLDGHCPPTLILVEHDPVITISRRQSAAKHLLAERAELKHRGIDVQPTDRGGDITYHGPGQIVAYPIIRLGPLALNVGRYMRLLEQIVIDTVATFGVRGVRRPKCTGVWICDERPKKLCAFGLRVRRNVTMHGLALNVSPDLSHYETIIPCGISDCGVTSLLERLGPQCPAMNRVKIELVRQTCNHVSDMDLKRESAASL